MEDAFFDTPVYREFAQLDEFGRLPDESIILRFFHRLEKKRSKDFYVPVKHGALVRETACSFILLILVMGLVGNTSKTTVC